MNIFLTISAKFSFCRAALTLGGRYPLLRASPESLRALNALV
jgi:hypothetical protein